MNNRSDTHSAQPDKLSIAIVQGKHIDQPPNDLYIPPDALEVFLETFEGPLDLLLYLIKRQNIDILNIPIAEITQQYVEYIKVMQHIKLDLAAEYLLMAAVLAEIKSRLLLPKHEETEEENDPRAELILRLQRYEQFKTAAENLNLIPRIERNLWYSGVKASINQQEKKQPDITLNEVVQAFQYILQRTKINSSHEIKRHTISIRSRMSYILEHLNKQSFVAFDELFDTTQGRAVLVVTFMATLELLKEQVIDIIQNNHYSPIYLKIRESSQERLAAI